MHDGERLAAYLVGELDADERAAVERELARNPALRQRLEAIRRADEALAGLGDVAPDPAFSARLRSELRADLRATLPDGPEHTSAPPADELATRRALRPTPRWVTSLGAAAAGLVFLVAVGVGITSLATGDDSGDEVALESAPAAGEDGDTAYDTGAAQSLEADTVTAPGPTVAALGRRFDAGSVDRIVEDSAFEVATADPDPATLAERYAEALGLPRATDQTDGDADAEVEEEQEAARAGDEAAPLTLVGDVTEDQLAAVRDCLPPLLEGETTRVPVYAELATYEGEEAVVYGLLAADAEGRLTRTEIWVVAVDDCEVRYFTQPGHD